MASLTVSLQRTHWHILGAGSLGCLWAFYLQQAGHRVTLIAKDDKQKQALLQAQPLQLLKDGQLHRAGTIGIVTAGELDSRLRGNDGSKRGNDGVGVGVGSESGNDGSGYDGSGSGYDGSGYDGSEGRNDDQPLQHLLVCLKAHQTEAALLAIKPCIPDNATMVLLQNGMGNQQLLAALFPRCATYAALTTEAACKRDALLVEHTGHGHTQLGTITGQVDTNLLQKMHCALPATFHPDIETALWQKLVINCCINPLTVVYRCRNGELAHKPEAQTQISTIIDECRAVACAINAGIDLAGMEQTVAAVIESTANNTSSMLQDVLQNRPTEIDYINGFVSRLGKTLGIATPANDKLTLLIQQGEKHE